MVTDFKHHISSRRLQNRFLSKLPVAMLCGVILSGAASAQAASPNLKAAAGSVPLTLYKDNNVSFLYPKAWQKQTLGGDNGVILLSNDKNVLTVTTSGSTPTLAKDKILIEILAGPTADSELAKIKGTGTALDALTNFSKTNGDINVYGTPEVVHLISSTDAAFVPAQDVKTKDDGLIILLSPADHPVFVVAIGAQGQLATTQGIALGIASSVQPGDASVATATIATPSATTNASSSSDATLPETFTNKVYTLNYPTGWVASASSGSPDLIYLATDQSLIDAGDKGAFSLTSGQILAGVASGAQVYILANASSSKPPTPSDLVSKLKARMVDSSGAIYSALGQPTAVTIGSQPGAEATLTLKNGNGEGYVIAFYVNKQPVLVLGMTAKGEAEVSRATFEQIAASITLNTP